MKTGIVLAPTQPIPDRLRDAIEKNFPDRDINDLVIRYYADVEDVGYEYFLETVLPTCNNRPVAHYLAPFIAYTRLGEALLLDKDGIVVYETDENDFCTETGPFWFVTSK